MTILSVTIMILLSITLGVAWKHWELLNILKENKAKNAVENPNDEFYVDDETVIETTEIVIMDMHGNKTIPV